MAEPPNLGGVAPEEIEHTAQLIGAPTIAGASLTTRFFRRVSALVATRAGFGESGQYTVFLRSEALQDDAKRCSSSEVPLLANGADPVGDRVWLSTASLSTSFELQLQWSDAGSLFKALRDASFGDIPAIVVDWRTGVPMGRLYRSGLNNHEDFEEVYFDKAPITRSKMKEVLDKFYERSLRNPSASSEGHAKRVWKESAKGIPESRPEEIIQGRLLDALKAAFAMHDLRAEPVTDDGRADIVVWKKSITSGGLPAVINEWVLELKALADRTTTGNIVAPSSVTEAIQSGLEQAVGYKTKLNALHAALCCYDMRKSDCGDEVTFSYIKDDAEVHDIPLWRWFLFRTMAASRGARGYLSPG